LGIVRRLLERGARLPSVAGAQRRVAERELERDTARPVGGKHREQLRRALEVADRLLVAELRRCLLPGAFRVLQRRDGVAEGRGAKEVMRQLTVGTIEAAGAQVLQRPADAPMQLAALIGCQVLVQGLADECVREPALTECRETLVEKTGRDGGAEL